MAKWDTITTDWPGATLPAGWFGYGTRDVASNKFHIPISGGNYAGATNYGNDLTDSYVMGRFEPGSSGYQGIVITVSGVIAARISKTDGAATIAFRVGATTIATITYSATDHAWWQIREASGTTYLETSPSGETGSWTTRASAANSATLTSCNCDLEAGGGSTGDAYFSKFNLVPVASGTSYTDTPTDTASTADALTDVRSSVEPLADSAVSGDSSTDPAARSESVNDAGAVTDQASDALAIDAVGADTVLTTDALTDVLTSGGGATETLEDSASTVDALTGPMATAHAGADTGASADALSGALAGVEPTADVASTTDGASIAMALTEMLSDLAGTVDGATNVGALNSALVDTAMFVDAALSVLTRALAGAPIQSIGFTISMHSIVLAFSLPARIQLTASPEVIV